MPGLCQALEQAIAENSQQELLEAIEIPLSFVLAQMEHIGFYVDKGEHPGLRQGAGGPGEPAPRRDYRRGGGTSSTSTPPSSWERPCSASWACPTGKDQERLVHQRRRAGGAAAAPPGGGQGAALPHRGQAEIHLLRRAAEGDWPGRAGALHLQPDGNPHRADLQRRAQPAEHPRAHPHRPGAAEVLRLEARPAGGRGLLPD